MACGEKQSQINKYTCICNQLASVRLINIVVRVHPFTACELCNYSGVLNDVQTSTMTTPIP